MGVGMISKQKIYMLNSEGKLMQVFSGKKECLEKTGIGDKWFYQMIRNRYMHEGKFYLSLYANFNHLRLGKKSKIKVELTVGNYNTLRKYRDNLILFSDDLYYAERARLAINKEIKEVTKFLLDNDLLGK